MTYSPAAGTAARNQYGTFQVRYATERQQAYIVDLASKRDVSTLDADNASHLQAAERGELNRKAASRLLDALLALPEVTRPAAPKRAARPASEKQVAFVRKLMGERILGFREEWTPEDAAAAIEAQRATFETQLEAGQVGVREASTLIDALLSAPQAPRRQAAKLELGMYRKADGTMYRVYPARESGRILAKRLVEDGFGGWAFEYAGMADRFVSADERMSLEEAKEWGAQFGTCCVCAALLTDPTSVAAGIGPICASRV